MTERNRERRTEREGKRNRGRETEDRECERGRDKRVKLFPTLSVRATELTLGQLFSSTL